MSLTKLIEAVEEGTAHEDFLWSDVGGPVRAVLPNEWFAALSAYNGSLDAAKRLHDALLPGWHLSEMQEAADPSDYPGRHWLVVLATREEATHAVEATAADPARAWLLAILRALEKPA